MLEPSCIRIKKSIILTYSFDYFEKYVETIHVLKIFTYSKQAHQFSEKFFLHNQYFSSVCAKNCCKIELGKKQPKAEIPYKAERECPFQ